MAYIYVAIVDLASIASGTYLVITEHYGWAWIPFLSLLTLGIKSNQKD